MESALVQMLADACAGTLAGHHQEYSIAGSRKTGPTIEIAVEHPIVGGLAALDGIHPERGKTVVKQRLMGRSIMKRLTRQPGMRDVRAETPADVAALTPLLYSDALAA